MPHLTRLLLLLATVALLPALAAAAPPTVSGPVVDVQVGWDNLYRPGRWVPLYVTVADSKTRSATLELDVPQAGNYVMRLRHPVTIGPVKDTHAVYVPLVRYGYDTLPSVILRDDATGREIKKWSPEGRDDGTGDAGDDEARRPRAASTSARFVAVVGRESRLPGFRDAFSSNQPTVVYVPRPLAPDAAIGYDAADLLVLYRADVSKLSEGQQKAIADWVRAGGAMLVIPSDEPTPATGPLSEVLPCRVGSPAAVAPGAMPKPTAGTLPPRQTVQRRFELTPRDGAEPIKLFAAAPELDAVTARVGFGRVVVAPLDVTQLQFDSTDDASRFYDVLLGPTGVLANEPYPESVDAAARAATGRLQDHLADVPGAGRFGFGYVAWGMLGMMLLVGPVDWFVLKLSGRQPWTWVTTAGWIGVMTAGAVLIGQAFKSGDLHYRSVQVIDQADGQVVARQGLIAIYSPRTTAYALETAPAGPRPEPPPGWWQPASAGDDYARRGPMTVDLDFTRTDTGNAPGPMTINVWNVRFAAVRTYERGDPLVAADLKFVVVDGKHELRGTIRNLSPYALTDLRLRWANGVLTKPGAPDAPASGTARQGIPADAVALAMSPALMARLGPGESVEVAGPTIPLDAATTDNAVTINPRRWRGRYDGSETPPPADWAWAITAAAAAPRAVRADVEQRELTTAVLYAKVQDAPPPATLRDPEAKVRNETVLRAIVRVRAAGPATRP